MNAFDERSSFEERLQAQKIAEDYERNVSHTGKGITSLAGTAKDILTDANLSPERIAGYLKETAKQMVNILMAFSTSGLASSMRYASLCGVNLPGLAQLQTAAVQRIQASVGRAAMRFADLAKQSRPGEDRMGFPGSVNSLQDLQERVDRLENRVRSHAPRPGR
jgi:hypothetical protein